MRLAPHRRQGFTLVEIMVVVAIIGLLAAIAVPGFLRARKRAQAGQVINDLRILDASIDQYAVENSKIAGGPVTFSDLQRYLKKDGILYNTGQDVLGHDYGPFTVDSIPVVPTATWEAFSDVADQAFWSPYY
jgi:prepilin-type N-terminal cleavage/methylation domain-containing protein